ncbi:Hypothetical protein CINCED_3A008128 [Cinara cedri]|uniref:Uncharacterized protein n=1 Tax=Cinara cedri TaxID=506608 RepID=A0A5E4MU40_9HEMI|nr:Hypothetical protein CINCED_3A008128 [Cinara cedri]
MPGGLKAGINSFVFGVDKLFTPSKSRTNIMDLRALVVHNVTKDEKNIEGRQFRYPKNYHDIVENGIIQRLKDSRGNAIPGKYELLFGNKDEEGKQSSFPLALVVQTVEEDSSKKGVYHDIIYKDGNKYYFTIEELIGKDPNNKNEDCSGFYEPFDFSKKDLEKYLPVFEVKNINADKKQGKDPIYKLTNSSIVTQAGGGQEVPDKKCRNGELLYTSYSGPSNLHAFAITDERGNLEMAKSLFISIPIMFVTSLIKIFANFVTSPFVKIGERLMNIQNPTVQAFARVLRGCAELTKNIVNIVATILRIPILLFTANKEKYSDVYYTLWKEQFKECWSGIKNGYKVITSGKVAESEEAKDNAEHHMIGTWKELDARRPEMEYKFKKTKPLNSRVETVVTLDDIKTSTIEVSNGYVDKEKNRQQQRNTSITGSRSKYIL